MAALFLYCSSFLSGFPHFPDQQLFEPALWYSEKVQEAEVFFLQTRNGEHGKDLYPGGPHRVLLGFSTSAPLKIPIREQVHGNSGLSNGKPAVFYILSNKLCSVSLNHMCAAGFSPVSKYGSACNLLEMMPVPNCSLTSESNCSSYSLTAYSLKDKECPLISWRTWRLNCFPKSRTSL